MEGWSISHLGIRLFYEKNNLMRITKPKNSVIPVYVEEQE